jgi:hypothetical protein
MAENTKEPKKAVPVASDPIVPPSNNPKVVSLASKPAEQTPDQVSSLIESIRKEVQELRKDRDILLQVADKAQLARYYSQHQTKTPKILRLRSMELTNANGLTEEKVVMAWTDLLSNRVEKERPNFWAEDQKVKLIFEDGSSQETTYMHYVQRYKLHIQAKVLSSSTDEATGEVILKVQRLDNNNELSINLKFAN